MQQNVSVRQAGNEIPILDNDPVQSAVSRYEQDWRDVCTGRLGHLSFE